MSHCSETSSGLLLLVILFSEPINTNSILHKILAKERGACLHRDDWCRGGCIFAVGNGKLFVRLDGRTKKEESANRKSKDESDE